MGGILLHLRTPVLRQLLARPFLAVTWASPIRLHSGTWPILVGAWTVWQLLHHHLQGVRSPLERPRRLVGVRELRRGGS